MNWVRFTSLWIFALASFASLSSCDSGSGKNPELDLPSTSELKVTDTYPKESATDFPLDGKILITFDQKIDAYSEVEQNFELWSQSGNRVASPKLISGRFIPDPNHPDRTVSQIEISLDRQYLLPFTKYILQWGKLKQGSDQTNIDGNALGIQNLYGAQLENGGLSFTTNDKYTSFNSDNLEVLSISPGRVLSRGGSFDFNSDLGGLFGDYFASSRSAPIDIRFSEPIIDDNSAFNMGNTISELKPTPIQNFSDMMVAVFDSSTKFEKLFGAMEDIAPNDDNTPVSQDQIDQWNQFRDSYENRLTGSVSTTNGRKDLIFHLDPSQCYPNTKVQVVIVILWNLTGYNTHHRLLHNYTIGGFVHFSGAEFSSLNPLSFNFDFLNLNQGGNCP